MLSLYLYVYLFSILTRNKFMKKIAFLTLFAFVTVTSIQAQIKFGIKVGLNLANLTGDVEGAKMIPSFHAGALVNFALNETIGVQPEVLFSGQGTKGSGGKDVLSYVNVPLLVQYNHTSGFYAEAGPQIGFLISAKEKLSWRDDFDLKNSFKSIDFSGAVGLGFKTSMGLGFGARYNFGLTNLIKERDAGKIKNSVIAIHVFYMFGGSKE